jgi:hypothetical protein
MKLRFRVRMSVSVELCLIFRKTNALANGGKGNSDAE